MSGKVIIGLTGYAQVGKDTVGEYLVKKYGFTRASLADGIRSALLILNPLIAFGSGTSRLSTIVDGIGWEEAKKIADVRRLLQVLGTEVGRGYFGESCWIDKTARDMSGLDKVVITDVRYVNEAEFVRNADFDRALVLKVFRDGYAPINDHISDQGIPTEYTDDEVYNNSTVDDLHKAVDRFMTNHML